jgi:hypothetical protein
VLRIGPLMSDHADKTAGMRVFAHSFAVAG